MQIVPSKNGYPDDPKWLEYNWLFDGVNFIVFDSYDEKEEYIKINYPYIDNSEG